MSLVCCRLPRSLANTPLKNGDEILEINGIPIVDQDQTEVGWRRGEGGWGERGGEE